MEYVRALSCLCTFMSTKWKDSEDFFSAPFFQPYIVQQAIGYRLADIENKRYFPPVSVTDKERIFLLLMVMGTNVRNIVH